MLEAKWAAECLGTTTITATHHFKDFGLLVLDEPVHIEVDADIGLVHSVRTTAANAHDVTEAHNLLHGGETVVWCDSGNQGVHKREDILDLEVEWQMTMRPGRRQLDLGSEVALAEKTKASVGARVEHPFLRAKRLFGYVKVRYRRLAKNAQRLALLFGLGNQLTAEGQLRCSVPSGG